MIDFILDKILNTEIAKKPFDHKFINKIFPDNYFEELIINLPEKRSFIPINKSGLKDLIKVMLNIFLKNK